MQGWLGSATRFQPSLPSFPPPSYHMPGPGHKKKTKAKAQRPQDASPDALAWNIRAEFICDILNLPAIKSRSALKQIHSDVDAVQRKLDLMYVQHDDLYVRGTLCCDARLHDQLLRKGIIGKMVPLLRHETTRFAILRAFAVMSHNGSEQAIVQIAQETSDALIDVIDDKKDIDPAAASLCVVILSHCLLAAVGDKEIKLNVASQYPWKRVLKTMLDVLESPQSNVDAWVHAMQFLVGAAMALRSYYLVEPRAPQFLCALLHANNMELRIQGMRGLKRLTILVPEHITEAFWEHGLNRCDILQHGACAGEYQKAMIQVADTLDLVDLGRKLYSFIYRDELSIMKGGFMDENNRLIQTRLPFLMWDESLPHCAKALRDLGESKTFPVGNMKVSALDMADVLTIKWYLITSRYNDSFNTAVAGLARNPDELYYYYAAGVGQANPELKVQYSRKGLARVKAGVKIPSAKGAMMSIEDNYVRLGLLANSTEHALWLAFDLAETQGHDHTKWERSLALNYGRVYLMYIITKLLWEAPTLSADMREFKVSLQFNCAALLLRLNNHALWTFGNAWTWSTRSPAFAYNEPDCTQHRLTVETIRKHYTAGVKLFAPAIAQFGSIKELAGANVPLPAEQEALYAWFEEDPSKHDSGHDVLRLSRWSTDGLELYACSSCGNASAVLRKCSRCGTARYCDHSCQKQHSVDGHKKTRKAVDGS
ncbi:hypothetical protein BKA62DRAFT_703515 [Auriculariales sp. MPI-PUGE-AT-0066]|nr:hypothetical protein BKA62DRAFT_703515 [Auriculariales sp. MPI-PUGE-AT-0066]